MASLSQSTINPETSKPTIQNLVDSLTKSENLLKDAKMLDSLKKLIAGLKDIELQFLMKSGHNTVDVGVRVQTVLDRIHVLSNNLGPYDDQEFALQAVSLQEKFDTLTKIVSKLKSQMIVNKEISESIIPKLVNRLTKVEKSLTEKVKGYDKVNTWEHLKKLLMRTEKVKGYDKDKLTSEDLKELIVNLNEIKEFFMNSGQDIAEGAQVKNVLDSILHKLCICGLETTCGLKGALRAVLELKADQFVKLNEIVSMLKRQELTKSKILVLADQLNTEADNLINSSDNKAKARGVLVKTVIQRTDVSAEKLYDLGTDDGKKVDHLRAMKANLDELSQTLTRLKHQAPVLSAKSVDGSIKVSEISETIIPGVVTRLQLANMYSLSRRSDSAAKELKKLTNDLSYIRSFLKNMEDTSRSLSDKVDNFEHNATVLVDALVRHSNFDLGQQQESQPELQGQQEESQTEVLQDQELKAKIRVLNKVVMKLKHQISSSNKLSPTDSDASWYKKVMTDFDYSQVLDILPVLHQDDQKFKSSKAFGDFRRVYESLELTTKLCLLCFALIPENEVVKKRFMTHWWVGEGFVSPISQVEKAVDGTLKQKELQSVEEVVDGIFKELVKKNCIEPVDEKHKYVVDSYKMNPLIRSAVIVLAKEAQFFDFDDRENPSAYCNKSYRACLSDGFDYGDLFKSKIELKSKNGSKGKNEGSSHGPDVEETGLGAVSNPGSISSASNPGPKPRPKPKLDAEKLQVIFNVNEPYPDVFELEWFSKLKNVKVLYLGRWQTSAKHHIEVEGTDFLTGLKSMKLLRFLSLQGISRITKLPDSVCKLVNLMILDLRACHNLEAIPNGIGSLKNLTHLDISECYLVDSMPKGISFLSNLQVLKGFVVSHRDSRTNSSCSLEDLSILKKLRKLSIYTNSKTFPEDKDATTLVDFKGLQKLTITWGAGAFQAKADNNAKEKKGKEDEFRETGAKENESVATTATSSEKAGDKKTQVVGGALPIAATAKSPEESEEKKRQDRDAAQPIAATAKSPEESEEKKRQARDAAQPVAATAKSPEDSEEKKMQDRDAAQPIAATAKSPEESEEKKRQDRDAAQPIAATAKSPEESEEKKRQARDAAQPVAATAKSPEDSEEKKMQDRDAAQPIAATAKSPEESEEKKRQDRGAAQPKTTTTTTPKNSGGDKNDQDNGESQPMEGIRFEKLQKLDLKCYPRETPPRWLHPINLPHLKKLYIRGGTLQNLQNLSPDEWKNVEVLRLKFLSKLKMDYKKLRSSFPSLIYLENFRCPKLTYFPCNENGVIRLK